MVAVVGGGRPAREPRRAANTCAPGSRRRVAAKAGHEVDGVGTHGGAMVGMGEAGREDGSEESACTPKGGNRGGESGSDMHNKVSAHGEQEEGGREVTWL